GRARFGSAGQQTTAYASAWSRTACEGSRTASLPGGPGSVGNRDVAGDSTFYCEEPFEPFARADARAVGGRESWILRSCCVRRLLRVSRVGSLKSLSWRESPPCAAGRAGWL